ncbi:hypothetical protein PYCCODRAFT_1467480 [Trametes coccinea BRFM310]|uniref:Uncharacterized protein n=1 Tax=Trametes coccinea (strain BRFM310) TaxID=1353009 RepID=A0A1Y2IRE6_TRAC3|nr:hypothetical protein PYCCODRAFT_1467480 [Trametes coccinea BRFM310]
MPRRSPPTPLRLHTGPLPARGKPKHTLPSLPRPAFHGPHPLTLDTTSKPVPRARMTHTELPALAIPESGLAGLPGLYGSALEMGMGSAGPSSPTSAGSASSGRATPESGKKRSREWVRGPWDHSGAIQVPFDVGAVLPPPRPVAINVR